MGGSAAGRSATYVTVAALALLAAGRCLEAGRRGWITTKFVLIVGLVFLPFGKAETSRADATVCAVLGPIGLAPQSRAALRRFGMAGADSTVTIHMAASLDGFIARADGRTDWMETSDQYADGESMDPEFVRDFLQSIDCYVMGSRTYETALAFDAKGLGWSYGEKPVFVLTTRALPKPRDTVELVSGDLAQLLNDRLRPAFRNIWLVGGSNVAGEAIRRGLAEEVRYSILPVIIGQGIPFFEGLDRDVALHLREVKAYNNGIVALRHEVRRDTPGK